MVMAHKGLQGPQGRHHPIGPVVFAHRLACSLQLLFDMANSCEESFGPVTPLGYLKLYESETLNSGPRENSKCMAKIALVATVIMYVISLWISDWSGIWIIGAIASVILCLDHVIYL